MTPNGLTQAQQPLVLFIFLVLQAIILFVAVSVAMDTRDRGYRKDASIFWFFGIVFFPPVVFIYLFMRGRRTPPAVPPSRTDPINTSCPYCGGPVSEGTKICPACGRLL